MPQLPVLVATEFARRAKIAGDWRRAARCYRIALVFNPENAAALIQYGNALRECGALADAEDAYRRALRIDPLVPDAHLQLGHALKLQRRFADAIAAYRRAIELDPLLYDASLELLALGDVTHVMRSDVPAAGPAARPAAARQLPLVVFDASDLLGHLAHAGTVTGIQRVQICIIASLLRDPDPEVEVAAGCFREGSDEFAAVPADFFLRLVELVQSTVRPPNPAWRQAVRQLIALRVHGEPLQFREEAALINLGTSWTLANYFLTIRMLKSRCRLRYVAFVHDCIPALFPELCATQTVRDYLGWVSGVFRHADLFLVNSSTTARDLIGIGATLGHSVATPRRIALDARFQGDAVEPVGREDTFAMENRREREPFVLFVASFELRKNHRAAFRAWLELIERRGRRNVPLLVCVGGRGWQCDATMQLLRSSRGLRSRVRVLSGVSDAVLDQLYRDCLFTLYPSLYEGWGLPVTESLSYAKVPLVADVPALRESGGNLAEYFDPAEDRDLVAKLQLLIDDRQYRDRREAEIRQDFRGRAWREVAQDILDAVGPTLAPASVAAAPIEVGRYYPMARNTEMRLAPGLGSGEVYRLGEGWWALEEWGCWLKEAGAELAFQLPHDTGEAWLQLDLQGNPVRATDVAISAAGSAPEVTTKLMPHERYKIEVRLVSVCRVGVSIAVRGSCALGAITGGSDRRVVSIGVRGFILVPGSSIATAAVAAVDRRATTVQV
jgi:glycosyltransferase involved in cell wall biosynthesis